MKKRLFVKVLSVMLILCIMLPTALAASFSAKVYSNSAKLYEQAKTSSKTLETLKNGTKFTVKAVSGSWAKVTYGKKNGYIPVKDIISLKHDKKVYTTTTTYVYKSASTGSKVVDQLYPDYPLWVVGENGSFYLVDDANGKFTAYIAKGKTSTSKVNKYAVPASSKVKYNKNGSSTTVPSAAKISVTSFAKSQGNDVKRRFIAYIAESKLGARYNQSGSSNTAGYSNASFIRKVFAELGYSVGSSISSISKTTSATKITKRSDLKIGDIVCLHCDDKPGKNVDHIGIYVGRGYFVHASPIAKCVVISNLDNQYYRGAFLYARRVVK